MTSDFESKAAQVIESAYKSLGGSGSDPDVGQFKTQVENASPSQVAEANQQIWRGIIQPLCQQGGQALPQNVVQEVSLVTERMHKLFTESSVGART